MLHAHPHPRPQQAVKYLKEMPAAGVPPTLLHFKQALKACEKATSRALTGGGASSPPFSSLAASAALGGRPAGGAAGSGSGRQGWEADVAAAVAAVPVIFELVRETADLSPDDDCYSSAMRCATDRPTDRPPRLCFFLCVLHFVSCFACNERSEVAIGLFPWRSGGL